MTQHVILISHGVFCDALKESTEMIMGPQDIIHAVALLPEEGPDAYREKLVAEIEKCGDNVVILADLMGGTPCNVASRLLLEGAYQFDLYAGMNMPMVIGFLNNALAGLNDNLTIAATENIKHVNTILFSDSDDEDE